MVCRVLCSDVFSETPLVFVSLRTHGAGKHRALPTRVSQMFEQVSFVRKDTSTALARNLRRTNC